MILPAKGTPRILMFATLVNTFGTGAYLTVSALFLTRVVGLSAAQIAIGLSAGALAAMLLTTPMGYLVDRRGPRQMQVAALLALGASFAVMPLVTDLWEFAALACVITVGDATVKAANGAMIAGAVPASERVRTRAFMRSTNNAGIALGTLAGFLPLAVGRPAGFVAVLLVNAVTCVVAAVIVGRAKRVPAVRRARVTVALRDRPFVAFALADGLVAALYLQLLTLTLPLWLISSTNAPVTMVSVALLVNTIGCVALQVWASRGVQTASDAIPFARRGALVVALACPIFAFATGQSAWLASLLILAGVVAHVLGELWLSSASFAVIFDLAAEGAQGQYQAAHQTGRQIGNMAAPPILTALVIGWGAHGWVALAAIFAVAAVVTPLIIRRAHHGSDNDSHRRLPGPRASYGHRDPSTVDTDAAVVGAGLHGALSGR